MTVNQNHYIFVLTKLTIYILYSQTGVANMLSNARWF